MAQARYRTLPERVVDRLSVDGKDAIFRDCDSAGFGIRVHSSGNRVFVVRTRAIGRSKRVALGRFPSLLPTPPARTPPPSSAESGKAGLRPRPGRRPFPPTPTSRSTIGATTWRCAASRRRCRATVRPASPPRSRDWTSAHAGRRPDTGFASPLPSRSKSQTPRHDSHRNINELCVSSWTSLVSFT